MSRGWIASWSTEVLSKLSEWERIVPVDISPHCSGCLPSLCLVQVRGQDCRERSLSVVKCGQNNVLLWSTEWTVLLLGAKWDFFFPLSLPHTAYMWLLYTFLLFLSSDLNLDISTKHWIQVYSTKNYNPNSKELRCCVKMKKNPVCNNLHIS